MLSTVPATTRIVSVEIDANQANAATELFAAYDNVTIVKGDSNALCDHGPFDLLILDALAGDGPLDWSRVDPVEQLRPNGMVVKDDLWPTTTWPPLTFDGTVDEARMRLFDHPDVLTSEITLAEGYSMQVARRRP